MATTGLKSLVSETQQAIDLAFMREAKLIDTPLIVQEWIRELQAENDRLKESNIKLHKELGSTCFNPIQID